MEVGFQEKNLSRPFFDLGDVPLTAGNFPSSGAGAITLAKKLLEVADLKFDAIGTANTSPEEVVLSD